MSDSFLQYLTGFRLNPSAQVKCTFNLIKDTGSDLDEGDLDLHTEGLWVETILYEVPLLALVSEAYFRFCDRDWNYDGQAGLAKTKGLKLLQHGCLFSEFGTRRRRDYHTQELIMQGLIEARAEGSQKRYNGSFASTSNIHLARKFNLAPTGTMAHEWFMGVAAATNNYPNATETALKYWVETFGRGVFGTALTDTFGTPHFLQAFKSALPPSLTDTSGPSKTERYADVFTATRQDSGNPLEFIKMMRQFYDREGVEGQKTIVFSDSLNVDRCVQYKDAAEAAGFKPTFGIGTFFTSEQECHPCALELLTMSADDFSHASDGSKSGAMNIVIKLSSANGRPAVKISDNIGKNTGDSETVAKVKKELGYVEHAWDSSDDKTT